MPPLENVPKMAAVIIKTSRNIREYGARFSLAINLAIFKLSGASGNAETRGAR